MVDLHEAGMVNNAISNKLSENMTIVGANIRMCRKYKITINHPQFGAEEGTESAQNRNTGRAL